MKGSRLEVKFDCDALGDVIREVVVESGSGHGFSLAAWRLRRTEALDFEVLGYAYPRQELLGSGKPRQPGGGEGLVAQERIPAARVEALLDKAHAALLARPREILPPSAQDGAGTFSMSSNDFHRRLRLVDAEGRVLEGAYTGYEGSDGQAIYLPLLAGSDDLVALLEQVPSEAAPASTELRALFAERFLASRGAASGWWVEERMVELAKWFGSAPLIPALLAIAQKKAPEAPERWAGKAVEALVAITGWDPRLDAKGKPRPTKDVAADFAAECSRP